MVLGHQLNKQRLERPKIKQEEASLQGVQDAEFNIPSSSASAKLSIISEDISLLQCNKLMWIWACVSSLQASLPKKEQHNFMVLVNYLFKIASC